MVIATPETLQAMFKSGFDFENAIREAAINSPIKANLFTVRPETDFDTPLLIVTWSWRRYDITQKPLADITIQLNSNNWMGAPDVDGLPETICIEWNGTLYDVPLVHNRTVGCEPYRNGGPFYVEAC
ncbi:MAG: hypothetical protein OSB62_07885 [Alphaproteobacteria bacterium]|nr:hypothetical protein [Alphaproteobacteria bacterium]